MKGEPKRKSVSRIELVCLKCSLPICDETAKGCLYAIKKTAPLRQAEKQRKAKATVDKRARREAAEIKTGLVFILTDLIAQKDAREFR